MKYYLSLFLIFCLLAFSAPAQTTPTPAGDNAPFNLGIIPTPQLVVRTDGILDAVNHPIYFSRDLTRKEIRKTKRIGAMMLDCTQVDSIEGARYQNQAYRLVLTPTYVHLYFVSNSGYNYGLQTLNKLLLRWNGQIPCVTITDWPAYEYRGWLDDISRGPVPNDDFARFQVLNTLDKFNMNFNNYYTEHTYYNPDMPDIAPQSSTLVLNSTVSMYNLQCFAHFEKTLRIPFYEDMMDTRYNLNPGVEKTYQFLASQIANVMKHTPEGQFFNINCDETEGLGSGRARAYVDSIGAEEAYCRHINRVYDLLKPYNKEILMWGDIVGKNPAMLERLPKDMQYIVWSYVPASDFSGMIAPFKDLHQKQGTQFWVAPGVSHWSHVFPSQNNYIPNIAYLARDGYLAGARGLMNTAWDDSGESLFGDCWHAMAWAAEMAWHPITNTEPDLARQELAHREKLFNENYNSLLNKEMNFDSPEEPSTEIPFQDFTGLYYAVGRLASNAMVGDWYNTGALYDPLLDFYPSKVDSAMLLRCDSVERLTTAMLCQFGLPTLGNPTLSPMTDLNSVNHATYAIHRIQVTAEKCRLRMELSKVLNHMLSLDSVRPLANTYFHHLHQLKKEYITLWDMECTDYSRDIICERFDNLGREVQQIEQHVFISTLAKGDQTLVALQNLSGTPIYYTLDGRRPSNGSNLYSEPFPLEHSCEVKALSFNPWGDRVETSQYLLQHKGMGHLQKCNTSYSTYRDTYTAGGDNALLDGTLGSDNTYNDGHWQGYWGQDVDVEMDFGNKQEINQISMRFFQCSFDWILAPKQIDVYLSTDGKNWVLVRTENFNPNFRQSGGIVRTNAIRNLKLQTRYLRIVAKNPGKLPNWNPGKGYDSYLFCDEIVIE